MSGGDLLTLGLAPDLNLASAEDLEAIPGIGLILASGLWNFGRNMGHLKTLALFERKLMGAGN